MSEEELIEGLKSRNEQAFIWLIELYKRKVISLCSSYTQDYHEAEDLSQEVFISLYNSINNFRKECSLSTYIYKIAVSRCLDYKRKTNIKSFLTGLFKNESTEDRDVDDRNFIREAIKSLPNDLKTPVVLFYYTGLSQKEIGEILKITTKTVEGRIYRAKQKLRLELEKGGYNVCSRNEMI